MDIDIQSEIKQIILNTASLKNTFTKTYPNTKFSLDLIISELLYFLKSGVSWRYLRSEISYKTLHRYYVTFVKANVFLNLFLKIRRKYITNYINKSDNVTLYVDSTIIYNKSGINKLGRNKFYKNKRTTKISLMTDSNGFPLSILFMKGNYHDTSVFNNHIHDATVLLPNIRKKVIADKGYASNANYKLLNDNDITHIIPPRKNMKIAKNYIYDKKEYKQRILIEQIFGRLKSYKRINLRYDKLLRNFKGFSLIAFSIIGINILNKISD